MARAAIRRPFTAEARVRSQFSPCEICGEQCGTATRFIPSISYSSRQYHSTTATCGFSPIRRVFSENTVQRSRENLRTPTLMFKFGGALVKKRKSALFFFPIPRIK